MSRPSQQQPTALQAPSSDASAVGPVSQLKKHLDRRRWDARTLANHIRNAANCLESARDTISREQQIHRRHWRALALLAESTYCLCISDMARGLRISRQAARRMALRMERRNWIRFRPIEHDRRLVQLELTDAGRFALLAAEGRFNTWLVTVTADLRDHELHELIRTMRALHGRIAGAREAL